MGEFGQVLSQELVYYCLLFHGQRDHPALFEDKVWSQLDGMVSGFGFQKAVGGLLFENSLVVPQVFWD